jgi:hypothetical protein
MLESRIAGYEDQIFRLQSQLKQASSSNSEVSLLK